MGILSESQSDRDQELANIAHKSLKDIQAIKIATPDSIRVYDEKEDIQPDHYIDLYKSYKSLNMLAYIKTLMNTSATRRHPELFKLLKKTKYKQCLDYGSGVGTHSIALAENDNEVTLYDVGGSELQHFAVHRMLYRGLYFNVAIHTDILPQNHYDVVICSDVLEHVKDPIWELGRINSILKSGGILHLLVSTMVKPSSGHFADSIKKWKEEGMDFMNKYFIKEGQTIYRKK